MNEPSSRSPLPSQDWSFLARGEQENESVARCPSGHIHLDYGRLTVSFDRDEFLAFARMVTEAVARLQGISPNVTDRQTVFKSSNTFSLN